MTLAIQWGYPPYDDVNSLPLTQGFIYFDAVTAYKRSYTGSVSKNPIDGGGLISDHFTRENPVITISAVISSVDISIKGINIFDLDGNSPNNTRWWKDSVKVNSNDKSLTNFLPDVVGQFFTPTKPQIVLASQPVDTLEQVRDLLTSLFDRNKVELVKLYEYENSQLLKAPLGNLVLTSLSFNETPESGEGLYCELTLEQITFVSTRTAQVPSGIREALLAQDLQKKGTTLENEGKKDSTVRTVDPDSSVLVGFGEKGRAVLGTLFESATGG